MEELRNAYRMLVSKYEGKRPLGRPGNTWETSMQRNLKDRGHGLYLSGSG
jgi:hypothetical protein